MGYRNVITRPNRSTSPTIRPFPSSLRFLALGLACLLILPFPGGGMVWAQSEEAPAPETETVSESAPDSGSQSAEETSASETVSETPPEPARPEQAPAEEAPPAESQPVVETAAPGEVQGEEPQPVGESLPTEPSAVGAESPAPALPGGEVPGGTAPGQAVAPAAPVAEAPAEEPPGPPAKASVVVITPTADTLTPEQRSALETRIQDELRRVDKYEVIPAAEARRRLSAAGLGTEDCADAECAARIGSAVEAAKAVVGTVVLVSEGQWLVNAMLVDVATGSPERTESVEYLGSFTGLQAGPMGLLAERLSGLEPAAPPPARTAQAEEKPEEEEEGGIPWWVYLLAGLGLAALAGGGGGGGGGDGGGGGGGGGGSSSGGVTVSW